MNNDKKKEVFENAITGEVVSLNPEDAAALPKEVWRRLNYERPPDVMLCWEVRDEERLLAQQEKKPYPIYQTETYFRVDRRIDARYIEGFLGNDQHPFLFHETIHTLYPYFNEYAFRLPVYFTFDRVTLYRLREILHENPLRLILERQTNQRDFKPNQAFMLMPFDNKKLDKCFHYLRAELEKELSIRLYRSKDFTANEVITETIYRMIEESEFVIADTTLKNKNVFYELGYAFAREKDIITIQDKSREKNLFFDRAHIKTTFYDTKKLKELVRELKNVIQNIRKRDSD